MPTVAAGTLHPALFHFKNCENKSAGIWHWQDPGVKRVCVCVCV